MSKVCVIWLRQSIEQRILVSNIFETLLVGEFGKNGMQPMSKKYGKIMSYHRTGQDSGGGSIA